MKRKIYDRLLDWKRNSQGKSALLLDSFLERREEVIGLTKRIVVLLLSFTGAINIVFYGLYFALTPIASTAALSFLPFWT